ncbi:MAG TPA: SUMF1/EgtB/PvdO family nonheme iron enzyme [Candidatus Dormibacteraeota bacterium]|nr:SUMF1/EgtB/PvdO family nonheme iron enzyme [Candidatus Dormibacteraeota bacterium]
MATARQSLETRRTLLERLADVRLRTDALFGAVKPEHIYERPIPERHRIVFYIGHLEAFDWNLLREPIGDIAPSRPELDRLFAFGIDPVGGGLPTDQPGDWPAIEVVRDYNAAVRQALDEGLAEAARGEGSDDSLRQRLNVAIEHRLMHEETLSYMLHQLPYEKKVWQPQAPAPAGARRPEAGMIEIPAGTARLGLERNEDAFGWDNEFEAHDASVPAFSIDRYMVTNGEYLKFLEAGGYDDRSLWSEPAWQWKNSRGIRHPAFWKRDDGRWLWRGMFDEFPLPSDWPVYVSLAEAGAYARWAGKALPSEAQWHRAAYGMPKGSARLFPWGNELPSARRGNFDFGRWDPVAVDAHPEGESAWGVSGMPGNGWEWTSSVFAPFPGFERFPFYPGYSANFFDGKHFTMKGGSPRTAAAMLRRTFRNWFQPHYQYVYAGFRCVSA